MDTFTITIPAVDTPTGGPGSPTDFESNQGGKFFYCVVARAPADEVPADEEAAKATSGAYCVIA
jgi:hypothetical protein